MVSVEQANEIVAMLRELDTEQNLMMNLFDRALRTPVWQRRKVELPSSGTTHARNVRRQGYRIH